MKKITVILPILFIAACAPKEKTDTHVGLSASSLKMTNSASLTATEELRECFDMFSGSTVLSKAFDSIEAEYPSMLEDIRFLKSDSLKGLRIDCIGMSHEFLSNDGHSTVINDSIIHSQQSLEETIKNSNYDFIGVEYSSIRGKIDLESLALDQQRNVSSFAKIQDIPYDPTIEDCKKFFENQAETDFTWKLLTHGVGKLYCVGTEPRWVWLTEQIMISMDLRRVPPPELENFKRAAALLEKCRSEISYSRTAQYLLKIGKEKRAALVYGSPHLSDYRSLQKKCGTTGKIF